MEGRKVEFDLPVPSSTRALNPRHAEGGRRESKLD
jgi:hypothetical protein